MQRLIKTSQKKGYKPQWVQYKALETEGLRDRDFEELRVFLGYKKGWESFFKKRYDAVWMSYASYQSNKRDMNEITKAYMIH